MKILFITYKFAGSASGIISSRIANEMATQGHEIKVLTESNFSKEYEKSIEIYTVKSILNTETFMSRALRKVGRILQITWFEYDKCWIWKCRKEIKNIVKFWAPDFIYCRSTPFEPFFIGKYLKEAYGFKVLMHFTDPSPADTEYPNKKVFSRRLVRICRDLLFYADRLSFGTKEMLQLEEELLNTHLEEKSFISPDVVKDCSQKFFPRPTCSNKKIVYFGSITRSRNPHPLFRAIEQLNRNGKLCSLLVYSKQYSNTRKYPNVHFVGRSENVSEALADADIFIDLDISESSGRNVYMSSKIKDYLLYNRPILSIATNNSPVGNMLKGLKTVIVVKNFEDEIYKALIVLLNKSYNDEVYIERKTIISRYAPELVVKEILNNIMER